MRKIKFRFTAKVIQDICDAIGQYPAETGGMLGSSDGGCTVDHFYFDHTAHTTGSTYSPDVPMMNRKNADWNAAGVEFVGFAHSHPYGCDTPSSEDIEYGKRIMRALGMKKFCMPIINVVNPPDGSIEMHPYCLRRRFRPQRQPTISARMSMKKPGIRKPNTEQFDRIKADLPLEVLWRKTVVCIGTGGAMAFVEDLARCGIGNFVLIDGDTVSATNIATQQAYISEIGRYKVEALRERVWNINPEANVRICRRFLDGNMTDDNFAASVGSTLLETPKDVLICGCTDNFYAQARSAALAMKYGAPYLAAQLYNGGMAAEIYFSYPGVTNHSCPRCAMSSRYEAYAQGYKNDVTSDASPIFATTRVNALKGQIALMLLLHGEKECVYGDILAQAADRNFVMIRINPLAGLRLGIGIFDEVNCDLSFFDETVWIPQEPNTEPPCPLCGGTGDLLALKGNIHDTRTDWGRRNNA